ncbi:hypothetical protein B4U79_11829 [Dinothrombium tinctorium]|uniref:Uncharacterized protein n=1 Tax=Dinothrombium tinctorium TaxID=1965070 RepID=A0A3S3PBM4_9ACAR|nr:hypothetical protein B4U79_11829 [Dinothrombium tinctorium]
MSILNSIDIYIRRWKRYDSNLSRKRLLIVLFCLSLFFLYNGPSFFRWIWHKTPLLKDESINCVEREINVLIASGGSSKDDVYIWKSYEQIDKSRKQFTFYVGNGKIGFSLSHTESGHFFILGKRALDTILPFYPFIETDYLTDKTQKALIIKLVDGIAHRVTCIRSYSQPSSVVETFYAHRFISSLFVHEIRIANPSEVPLLLKFKREGWKGTDDVLKQHMVLNRDVEYHQIQGQIKSADKQKPMDFIIAAPIVPETVEIEGRGRKTLMFRTFVNYTKPGSSSSRYVDKIPELKLYLRETVKKVIEMNSATLKNYHVEAWHNLWKSGFGISHSKAEGSVNGDFINATLYYILSQKSAFADDIDIFTPTSLVEHARTNALLSRPDSCYHGYSTLQSNTLWTDLSTVQNVNKIVSLWLLTLENQGCHYLIEAGAEGTMQALILSLAPFQFTKFQVQFNAQPKDLHRDYFIRRLRYGNITFVNITVLVGEDNKASIFVALDKNIANKQLYACDAGCLDPPATLTSQPIQFPVKETQPPTAILYITFDKLRLEEFKHSLHVKEVNLAPAHEHHIIALHRHGHQLGGLPALFWVSIVFLIVIFHLFLVKLIYNEYCGNSSAVPTYERVRYAV